MLRPVLLCLAGGSLLLAAGCRTVVGGTCHKTQAYESAGDAPPLRVPDGLEGPDTEEAMEIPALTEPERKLDPDGPCLDAPPAITAPPLPPSGILAPRLRRPGDERRPVTESDRPVAPETDADTDADTETTERRRPRRPTRPR